MPLRRACHIKAIIKYIILKARLLFIQNLIQDQPDYWWSLATKNLTSRPRQTKYLIILTLHMFNNNNCTDFRRTYKHVLIPSYVIWVIYLNWYVTKLNKNLRNLTFKVIFCFRKYANKLFKSSPSTHFFSDHLLKIQGSNLGRKGRGEGVDAVSESLIDTNNFIKLYMFLILNLEKILSY